MVQQERGEAEGAVFANLLEDKNGEKLTNKDFLFNKMAKNSALFVSAFWKAI